MSDFFCWLADTIKREPFDALTLVGAIVAAWIAITALNTTKRIAHADLLLRLDERFGDHNEVHTNLRPGGRWAGGASPIDADAWPEIDAYLGLFERIYFMAKEKLVSIEYVDAFYGYRYDNIVGNPEIRARKFGGDEYEDWAHFRALGDRLKAHRNRKAHSR